MDSPLQAPAVVAVVVTCDSGSWLEEALEALAAQDYPNLSVLVIDANSAEDPTPRVARILPDAFVRRLPANRGYAASANEALKLVDGASHYLLCHDDVVLAPDVVRVMVEEAFRSNAGIVAPKLLDWHEPARLLQVGMSADRGGAPVALAERGELDQAQHDNVRDVFFAPGGCVLVRADLFASLDGFDPLMGLYGEDLDFCWRAHIAGARVVVA
ncbi:MAG TPA: glycosyltransferase, partial [Acidimicrobiales bacterium]|nr:glycosyltransferase [Acidimicrobiales bacterium]